MLPPFSDDVSTDLSPAGFERQVCDWLSQAGDGLEGFTVNHLETVKAADGEYAMDGVARFRAFGADFLILVECKLHKNAIKREVVQTLHSKLESTGAQKGMIFSNVGFQRGAIEYAKAHGIALVRVLNGELVYETRGAGGRRVAPPPWIDLAPYYGEIIEASESGSFTMSRFSDREIDPLRKFLLF